MSRTQLSKVTTAGLVACLAVGAVRAQVAPPAGLQALTTRHYRIYSATGRLDTARETAADLEALWVFFDSSMGSLIPLRPAPEQVQVMLFPGAEELEGFLEELPPGSLEKSFPGLPLSLKHRFTALDGSAIMGRSDLALLLHEVAHLLLETSVYSPDVAGSWWVREGFATYIMQTRFDQNVVFTPGAIRTSEGYIARLSPGGRAADLVPFALQPKRAVDQAQKAYKERRHVPLAALLAQPAPSPWPDAATRDLAAVEAWILVHFLLHGGEGELRPRLARYLLLERDGQGGVDAFRRMVAGDLAALEPLVYRHVKEMN